MGRVSQAIDEIGNRYGKLTVVARHTIGLSKRALWECKCDCGKISYVIGKNLRSGNTKSCGCWLGEKLSIPNAANAIHNLLNQYKHGAKRRDLIFNLSENEFVELLRGNCHYCGEKPGKLFKASSRSQILYNGIDRYDNDLGYELNNCVSCCWRCNNFKGAMHGYEFVKLCKLIAERSV